MRWKLVFFSKSTTTKRGSSIGGGSTSTNACQIERRISTILYSTTTNRYLSTLITTNTKSTRPRTATATATATTTAPPKETTKFKVCKTVQKFDRYYFGSKSSNPTRTSTSSSSSPPSLSTYSYTLDEMEEKMAFSELKSRIISLREWIQIATDEKEASSSSSSSSDGSLLNSGAAETTKKEAVVVPLMDLRSSKEQRKRRLQPFFNDTTIIESSDKAENENNNNTEGNNKEYVVAQIPCEVLRERSFELPARHLEFSIFIELNDFDKLATFLIGSRIKVSSTSSSNNNNNNNKTNSKNNDVAKTHKVRSKNSKWKIKYVLIDTDEFWKTAVDLGIAIGGGEDEDDVDTHQQVFPLPRLWQPDDMVQNKLLPLLLAPSSSLTSSLPSQQQRQQQESGLQDDDDDTTTRFEIWDMASGAGRDVAFLAEELKAAELNADTDANPNTSSSLSSSSSILKRRRYKVIGIDHRYNEKETKIVQQFWNRRGVTSHTDIIKMDLSQWETVEKHLLVPPPPSSSTTTTTTTTTTTPSSSSLQNVVVVVVLFCVRFWKPSLIEGLAKSSKISKGTIFALSHFCKPYDGASWNFEHPSEKTVLERNQLRILFEQQQQDEEEEEKIKIENDIINDDDDDESTKRKKKKSKWTILYNEIATDSDHGRTMIHFVAQHN